MNRKTHLFYTTGNDSKFITFDNYTEALTGDILATNKKLFPCRFLCCYIKELDKEKFITECIENYYENKLAVLNDNLSESQKSNFLNPLAYLIDAIYSYIPPDNNQDIVVGGDDPEPKVINNIKSKNEISSNTNIDFCYIGDIVEMDYNGTYTDIICTISPNKMFKPEFNFVNTDNDYYESDAIAQVESESMNVLYGWKNVNGRIATYINNHMPNYDAITDVGKYYAKSAMNKITFNEGELLDEIKFNIIIPLFEVQDIEYVQNTNNIANEIELSKNKNVPLGIYFCDKDIVLKKDSSGYGTNWSLLISMQFSPFPYSYDIVQSFNDSDTIKDAYLTFAQILAKQANTIDLMNKYNDMISVLQTKISIIESIQNNIASINSIDDINKELLTIKNTVNNKLSQFEEELNNMRQLINANKLRWQIKSK